jgi:hypothetical protein
MMEVITKAELARELEVSRARITQLCQKGLPVRPDGKVNRAEAVAWVKANVCSWRGGWWGNMRKKNGVTDPAGEKELSTNGSMGWIDVSDMPGLRDEADYQMLSDYHRGCVDIVNALRRPGNIENMAEMALSQGCTMAQAYGVVHLCEYLMAAWMADFIDGCLRRKNASVIHLFETEPDWAELARRAGEPVEVERWKAETRRMQKAWERKQKPVKMEE